MKTILDPRLTQAAGNQNVPGKQDNEKNLKQVCQQFEAIFIESFFQEMRKTIPEGGYLEKDMGMDMFQELMDKEAARQIAKKGGFGLGSMLYRQLAGQLRLEGK